MTPTGTTSPKNKRNAGDGLNPAYKYAAMFFILVFISAIFLVRAYISTYSGIMYEDFEAGFAQRTGSCSTSPADDCAANSPWGQFNNCDDNNGDYIFCTSDDGQAGTWALRMIDWATFDSAKGLWYSFDPRNYDDVNVRGYVSAASLEGSEFCRVWVNDSDSAATIYQCTSGDPCEAGDTTPDPADYTLFDVNLSSLGGINLKDPQLSIHIGAQESNTQDYCFFDTINITGIIRDDPPAITSLDHPGNGSYARSPVDFNFTASDDLGFTNCTLWGNFSGTWAANASIYNTTIRNGGVSNITIQLGNGAYLWNVHCFDNATRVQGAWFNGGNYTVKLDSIAPSLTLHAPVQECNTTSGNTVFNFTANDTMADTLSCALYLNSALNQTNSSVANGTVTSFNVNGMAEGAYLWNITCSDAAQNSNSSSRNLTIDVSAPAINSMTISPGSDADVDPNVQINVTANLTDLVAIDTVIFQYRASNESQWTNDTMDYNGTDTYVNASFTPTFNGTWQYMIWANDTLGNSGISSNVTNISVQYEFTWTASPADLGAASAFVGNNATLGALVVNNTGDYPLRFDLSSDWKTGGGEEKVYYNETVPFTLDAKGAKALNVSALVSDNERSDAIRITIDATNASASPDSSAVDATLIAYVSGPVLYAKIATYSGSVNQSSVTELKAYVKNLGNETASDVSINWTLPAGWDSGEELNIPISSISVGERLWSNLTVEVMTSAGAGTATVSVNASSSQGRNGTDSVSIIVSCSNSDGVCGNGCTYLTDADCSVPTTTTLSLTTGGSTAGGGTIGGSRTITEVTNVTIAGPARLVWGQEIVTSSSETVELVRGESDSFTVTVKNAFENMTLRNVALRLKGYMASYLGIAESGSAGIRYNEAKRFTVSVSSPEYMEPGTYQLAVTITGELEGGGVRKNFTETRNVKLVIHSISGVESNQSVERAADAVSEMSNAGFPTTKASRLLEAAMAAAKSHDYETAHAASEKIMELRGNAFKAHDRIREISERAAPAGGDPLIGAFLGAQATTPETLELLNLAKAAFEREDYATALQRLNDVQMTSALGDKEFNILVFLLKNWRAILSCMALLAVTGFFGYRAYVRATISQRITNLEKEEESIMSLIKEAQSRRFKEKTMGPSTFQKNVEQYQTRLAKIRKENFDLRHKRLLIMEPKKLMVELGAERKAVEKSLAELQKAYFVRGRTSKTEYDTQTKAHYEKIAEIEDEIWSIAT